MQSTGKVSLAELGDKSLAEWPTLNDVCSNTKKTSQAPTATRNIKNNRWHNKGPAEKFEGYDSSKENEISSQSGNGRGARKKSSSRTKWVPVPIVAQPYKKRGTGRQFYDSSRNFTDYRNNESSDFGNDQENGRGGMRGSNRFRGKRGRGYSQNWRPRREETSRGEIENESPDKICENEWYNAVYYDPYTSKLREKELKNAIRIQIEYYFCEMNLLTDFWLRRRMDSQGFVPLTLIACFPRVKNLTNSKNAITEAIMDSSKLEMVDNKVRCVIDPLKWPLPDLCGLNGIPSPGSPYMSSLIDGINDLNLTSDVNSEKCPQSPDSAASLSPDQVGDYVTDFNSEQTVNCIPFYPETASPPEHEMNVYANNSVEPYVAYYSCTQSSSEHNGFNSYLHQMYDGMVYYSVNMNCDTQIPNGISFCGNSSPDDARSTATDNSVEDQHEVLQNKSPEPTR